MKAHNAREPIVLTTKDIFDYYIYTFATKSNPQLIRGLQNANRLDIQ